MKRIQTRSYRDVENWRSLLDSFCGKGNLIPHEGTVSKNRGVMFSNASAQYRPIVDGEAPIVDTKYSYDILSSSKNIQAPEDMRVVAKIPKILHGQDTGVCSYIFEYCDSHTYDYLEFREYEETGAGYGVKMKSDIPEDKIIEKGEYIVRTHTYGEDMVPQWGINALSVLAIDIKTIEDAGRISDNLAKRMTGWTYTHIQEIIDVNNDVLKNVYGNAEVYKPFPFIGEEIENEILMAISKNQRSHQYIKTGYGFGSVNKIDQKIFAKGKVVDITVRQKVGEVCQNSYLNILIEENRVYEREIFEIMKRLKNEEDANYTPDFEDKFYKLSALYDHEAGFRFKRILPNSHVIVDILIVNEEVPTCGQKITGRCGNKFTTASIFPYGKYYTKEFGNIDYIGNCLALFNRAIMLVPIEMYQTFITMIIERAVRTQMYPDDKLQEIILNVLNIMDKDMYETYRDLFEEYWEDFKEEPIIEWIQSTYHSGTTIKSCYEARNYLNSVGLEIKRTPIYTTDKNGVERCLGSAFVSKLFITPLKQVADTQLSIRAKGSYDARGIIIRDGESRKRNTPVRKSVLVGDIQSNTLHPDDLEYINAMTEQESVQVVAALFNAMGVEIKNISV